MCLSYTCWFLQAQKSRKGNGGPVLLLGARTLLGAPGLTTGNKKLLVTKAKRESSVILTAEISTWTRQVRLGHVWRTMRLREAERMEQRQQKRDLAKEAFP